jgi:tetratricopeptide (TPR) repeat protein
LIRDAHGFRVIDIGAIVIALRFASNLGCNPASLARNLPSHHHAIYDALLEIFLASPSSNAVDFAKRVIENNYWRGTIGETCINVLSESRDPGAIDALMMLIDKLEIADEGELLLNGSRPWSNWPGKISAALEKHDSNIVINKLCAYAATSDRNLRISLNFLSSLDPKMANPKLSAILDRSLNSNDVGVRTEAIEVALKAAGDRTQKLLEIAMTDSHDDAWTRAAYALHRSTDDNLLQSILNQLHGREENQRRRAIIVLGVLMNEEADGPLRKLLSTTNDPAIQIEIIHAINIIGAFTGEDVNLNTLIAYVNPPTELHLRQKALGVLQDIPEGLNKYFSPLLNATKKGDHLSVVTIAGAMLEADPTDIVVLTHLANSYKHSGKYEDAIRSYRKILEDSPDSDSAVDGTLYCLFKLEKYEEMINFFPIQTSNAYRLALNWKGVAQYHQHEYDESIKTFKDSIEYSPRRIEPVLNIILPHTIFLQIGDIKKYLSLAKYMYVKKDSTDAVITNVISELKTIRNKIEKIQKVVDFAIAFLIDLKK